MSGFNDRIIAEFRGNHGHVASAGFGDSLILLHTIGARSGVERLSPVMTLPDGDGWLIAASKAGAPDHPGWYFNLLETPRAVAEIGSPDGTELVPVMAEVLHGGQRDSAWARFTARSVGFADYEVRAGDRVIPVIRLSRVPPTR